MEIHRRWHLIDLISSRNYLIILFRDQPFELWDLKTFSLIRRLPKKCPRILALVIYSISSRSLEQDSIDSRIGHRTCFRWRKPPETRLHQHRRGWIVAPNRNKNIIELAAKPSRETVTPSVFSHFQRSSRASLLDTEKKSSRENFIFTDEYNLLYHFYVEGRTIKEVATVPPDVSRDVDLSFSTQRALLTLAFISSSHWSGYVLQSIVSSREREDRCRLVLKGDYLLSGDVDGIIQVFNIKLKQSK